MRAMKGYMRLYNEGIKQSWGSGPLPQEIMLRASVSGRENSSGQREIVANGRNEKAASASLRHVHRGLPLLTDAP